MTKSDLFLYALAASPLLLIIAQYRTGYEGVKSISMLPRQDISFSDPFQRNLGVFSYYSYTRRDNSRVCASVAPHLVLQTHRGISLKPVEFIFSETE
jgi:hypothetical protein